MPSVWIQALKEYNDGNAWCIPRRGTPEHEAVKRIMEHIQNPKVMEQKPAPLKRKLRLPEEKFYRIWNPKTGKMATQIFNYFVVRGDELVQVAHAIDMMNAVKKPFRVLKYKIGTITPDAVWYYQKNDNRRADGQATLVINDITIRELKKLMADKK